MTSVNPVKAGNILPPVPKEVFKISLFKMRLHSHSMDFWLLYWILQSEDTVLASPLSELLIAKNNKRPKDGKNSKARVFNLIIFPIRGSINEGS
ncbi:MAG TPA: hypothetical protein VL122_00365 [Nitrospirota bacterium]|nr:hypothetical protein [Nitrospirota bacterium]